MLLVLTCLAAASVHGQSVTYKVGGLDRTAVVFAPSAKSAKAPPLLIAFHGHGGTGEGAARNFKFQTRWPEAVVAYPQGLPGSPGVNDPEGKRAGWQKAPGQMGDRDVKFVDAIIVRAKKDYGVAESEIYACGHSNGSAMTWVLYAMRSSTFAGFSGASSAGGRFSLNAPDRPAQVICGMDDTVVSFQNVKRFADALVQKHKCKTPGMAMPSGMLLYKGENPVATYFRPGGHSFQPEWIGQMLDFFQNVVKKAKQAGP